MELNPDQMSPAQVLASLPEEEQQEFLKSLTPEAQALLRYNWEFWARPNQTEPPGDWTTWLVLAGRGFGKTRTGAEWVRQNVCGDTPLSPGRCKHIALVAETAPDARDVMVLGPAGLLACHPKDFRPTYYPSKRLVEWPNGAQAILFNAVEPDQLRGPQFDLAWCDELAKWRYAQETWDQLQFGLRLGDHPRQIVTTTPRPIPVVRRLVNDPTCFTTRGRTYDNAVNLAAPFLKQVEERYGNTRLGRQELEGEILDDMPGALWNRDMLDGNRKPEEPETLDRIIVAVDPAATSGEDADETGIVAVGIARDSDGVQRGYVLADRSIRGTPDEWASAAVNLYHELDADRIVAEKNQGGEMVEAVLRSKDRNVPVTLVHATRGKRVRAEPIAALYEQGRIHHVGRFNDLEDQMCLFTADGERQPGDSPDRVDALVWGFTSLFTKLTGRRIRKGSSGSDDGPIDITKKEINVYRGESDNTWMA
jgi:phage terminase large subunit-like protein